MRKDHYWKLNGCLVGYLRELIEESPEGYEVSIQMVSEICQMVLASPIIKVS